MRSTFKFLFLLGTATLTSCGSDSNQSTPITTIPPVNTPTPTPTPSPTPTPAPAPTASIPTGMTISSEATSPVVGVLQYAEASGSGTAKWTTDVDGHFPSRTPILGTSSIISAGFAPDYNQAVYKLSTTGIDRASRLLISATAPAGATTVSPITSLIDRVGSQSAVRAALQLDSGSYAVPSSVNLLTTSGTSTASGPILAANVRAVMLSQAIYVAQRGIGALDYTPFVFQNRESEIATFIRSDATVQLFTEPGARELLKAYGDRTISETTYAAMAHLIVIYADAATAIQSDPGQGTRYLLGLQSFFFDKMESLRTDSGSATAVQALSASDIATALAAFADYPSFIQTGTLFAGPDFAFLAPGASGSRRRWDQSRDGSGQIRTTGYAENDFTLNPSTLAFESVYTRGALISVTVPAANAAKISAGMQNSTITYHALPGFTGTTYFDYVISDDLGQQAAARFYVIVR